MATLTAEQIEQKQQQLKQLLAEAKQLKDELVEAGACQLDESDLDKATGGIMSMTMSEFFEVMAGQADPHKPACADEQQIENPSIEFLKHLNL